MVAILAALAAIAIPLFLNQKQKTKMSILKTDMRTWTLELETAKNTLASAVRTQITANNTAPNKPNMIRLWTNCSYTADGTSDVYAAGQYILLGNVKAVGGGAGEPGTYYTVYDSASRMWFSNEPGSRTLSVPDTGIWWRVRRAVPLKAEQAPLSPIGMMRVRYPGRNSFRRRVAPHPQHIQRGYSPPDTLSAIYTLPVGRISPCSCFLSRTRVFPVCFPAPPRVKSVLRYAVNHYSPPLTGRYAHPDGPDG